MFKQYVYVVAGLVVLFILAGSALNATWLTETVATRVLSSTKGVVVKRVHVETQQFSLPGRLELRKVDLVLEVNGKSMTLQAPQVLLTGLQTFYSSDRRILLAAQSILVRYDLGQAKDLKVDLTMDHEGVTGPLTAVEINWDKLRAKDVSAFLMLKPSGVELRAAKLAAYEGRVTGSFILPLTPSGAAGVYTIEMFMEGVDVARLAEVNPEIAAQLSGSVAGTVKLEGDARSLRHVDADLSMPSGGKMSASLLGALTQYLPQSREKKRLDVLILKGGKVALEGFVFSMKGGKDGKFSGEIRLRSHEINLELNLQHEINTDGTIDALLGYWDKFLK